LGNALVELIGLRNTLTLVVRFLTVLEVAKEPARILWLEMLALLKPPARAFRFEETRAVVVDEQHRHAAVIPG
jgi:hypothetical protein